MAGVVSLWPSVARPPPLDAPAADAVYDPEQAYANHVQTILLFQAILARGGTPATPGSTAAQSSRTLFGLGALSASWSEWEQGIRPTLTFALRPPRPAATADTVADGKRKPKGHDEELAPTPVAPKKTLAHSAAASSAHTKLHTVIDGDDDGGECRRPFSLEPITFTPSVTAQLLAPTVAAPSAAGSGSAGTIVITQNANGYGELGTRVWDSGLVLARYVESGALDAAITGGRVLELGAGTGLPSIYVAKHCAPRAVWCTDQASLVPLLTHNVQLNVSDKTQRHRLHVHELSWLAVPPLTPPTATAASAAAGTAVGSVSAPVKPASVLIDGADGMPCATPATYAAIDAAVARAFARTAEALPTAHGATTTAAAAMTFPIASADNKSAAAAAGATAASSLTGSLAAPAAAVPAFQVSPAPHALPSAIAKELPFDVVYASEVTYDFDELPKLVATLVALTGPHSVVAIAYSRERAATPLFLELASAYFAVEVVAPTLIDTSDGDPHSGYTVDVALMRRRATPLHLIRTTGPAAGGGGK